MEVVKRFPASASQPAVSWQINPEKGREGAVDHKHPQQIISASLREIAQEYLFLSGDPVPQTIPPAHGAHEFLLSAT